MRHPVVKSYEADLMSFHNTFYLAPKIKAINVLKTPVDIYNNDILSSRSLLYFTTD